MTNKVAIVTDSTAYIPQDLVAQYDIKVAPQVLIWGEKTYLDGIDILPEEFYARLENSEVMPSTSQVSPASLKLIYKDLIDTGHDILAVFVSEKLSGTIASANQALESFPGANIEIVDSYSTAMAMGFQVLAAARAAADGADLAECKALVEDARYKGGLVFAVNTLEFLHRGGRIGGGTRFLATALNIKPILELQDGVIEAVERVRTRKKSLKRLIELTEERVDGRTPLRIATLHANARQEALDLLAEAAAYFQPDETIFSEVSPVVGTHAGPGTIGLAFLVGR